MKRVLFPILLLTLLLGCLELLSWAGSRLVGPIVRRPPSRPEFADYFRRNVDFDVGWYSVESERAGRVIPRPSPGAEGLSRTCAQVFGDSFVYAHKVAPHEAWADLLSGRLGCLVENFGTVAHGPDQALLLFRRHVPGRGEVAILGHQSENIARVITRDRALLYDGGVMTKGRFVPEKGALELLHGPRLGAGDYDAYARDPSVFLGADPLLDRSFELSKPEARFPFTRTLLQVAAHPRTRSRLFSLVFAVEPWWSPLYQADHPTRALQITAAILQRFVVEARLRGQQPLLLLIPNSTDLFWHRASGRWTYEPLRLALEESGSPLLDLGPALLERVEEGEDLCRYFCTRPEMRAGHYTAEGNRLMAEIVAERLAAMGLPSLR